MRERLLLSSDTSMSSFVAAQHEEGAKIGAMLTLSFIISYAPRREPRVFARELFTMSSRESNKMSTALRGRASPLRVPDAIGCPRQ